MVDKRRKHGIILSYSQGIKMSEKTASDAADRVLKEFFVVPKINRSTIENRTTFWTWLFRYISNLFS